MCVCVFVCVCPSVSASMAQSRWQPCWSFRSLAAVVFPSVCINGFSLMYCGVQFLEARSTGAVSNRWTGLLEWTTGMDYWNGL